jgi:hypothetical protein
MALSLQYVGVRPYTELKVSTGGKKHTFGFARGNVRDDIPQQFIVEKIVPMIENGGQSWKVLDSKGEPAGAMKEALKVEEPPKEKNVVVETVETVVEKVKEAVLPSRIEDIEEKVVEKEVKADKPKADVEKLLADVGFSTTLTRAQMMAWSSENGIAVNNRSTKASMTDAARAFVTGASE